MGSPITDEYAKLTPPTELVLEPREVQMASFVDRQLASAEPARQTFLRQLHIGLSQYNTETQWHTWDDRSGELKPEPLAYPGAKRLTINVVKPVIDTIAAVMTNSQPGWQVTPATSEDEDVEAAAACEKLLDHVYRENEMGSAAVEWLTWALVGGIGWLNVAWDSTRGDEVEDEPTGGMGLDSTLLHEGMEGEKPEPRELTEGDSAEHKPYGWELQSEDDAEGEGNEDSKPVRRTGFPVLSCVPPMSIIHDPGATKKNLSDCQWIAHIAYLHIDTVNERWPERGMYCKPDTQMGQDSYAATLLSLVQGGRGGSAGSQAEQHDRCKVVSYYERPSRRHPRGYYCIKAGPVILEEADELPCGGDLPFVCVRVDPVPGRLWGAGRAGLLVDLQRQVNYQRTKLVEQTALHANPKWVVPKGAIKQSSITNKPAEVIEYDPNKAPPSPIRPQQISPEFRQIADESMRLIYDLAGVSEITRGIVQSGISGRAAGIMQEADAAKRQPAVREMAEALERIGRMVLMLWKDNMPIDVTIRTIGRNNRLEAMVFQAGNIRSTDVRIDMASMAIKHPTVQREQIMQAAERGLYGDIADPENLARIQRGLALPGIDSVTDGNDPEENYATEAAFLLMQGQPVPVHPWENHAAHIRVLHRLLQTTDARHSSPEVLDLITKTLATREAYQAAKASGMPWWQKMADPDALALLQPPQAPPEAPQAAPVQGPPPMDAFGAPPEAFIPQPPPIPTGQASTGMPLEGQGMPSLDTMAALQQPGEGAGF